MRNISSIDGSIPGNPDPSIDRSGLPDIFGSRFPVALLKPPTIGSQRNQKPETPRVLPLAFITTMESLISTMRAIPCGESLREIFRTKFWVRCQNSRCAQAFVRTAPIGWRQKLQCGFEPVRWVDEFIPRPSRTLVSGQNRPDIAIPLTRNQSFCLGF